MIFAETSYQWNRPWVKRSTTVLNRALVDELFAIKAAKHAVFTVCYVGWVFPDRGALNMLAAMEIFWPTGGGSWSSSASARSQRSAGPR